MKLSDSLFSTFSSTFSFPITTWKDKNTGVEGCSISLKPIESIHPVVSIDDVDITINDDTLNQLFADNDINAIAVLKTKGDSYKTDDGMGYYAYTRYDIKPVKVLDDSNKDKVDAIFS